MKAWALSLALSLGVVAHAEVYTPKVRPVIPALVLADGRTLTDAKILSDTAYTVNVASGGRIQPVEKKLLPAELLAQWPVDEVRGAKEHAAEQAIVQAAADKRAAEAAKDARIAAAVAAERATKAAAYAKKTAAEHAALEEKFYDGRAALEASRSGMLIEGVGSVFGKILVIAHNVSEGTLAFDWSKLRFATESGEADRLFTGVIFEKGQVENYIVQPHTWRIFVLRQVPIVELVSLRWEDRPEIFPVRQLYRLRSDWDMRDHRMDFKPLPAKGVPLPDDAASRILLAASERYVRGALRE